jgi:hypothetical protein
MKTITLKEALNKATENAPVPWCVKTVHPPYPQDEQVFIKDADCNEVAECWGETKAEAQAYAALLAH